MVSRSDDFRHLTDESSARNHRVRIAVCRGLLCTNLQSQFQGNPPTAAVETLPLTSSNEMQSTPTSKSSDDRFITPVTAGLHLLRRSNASTAWPNFTLTPFIRIVPAKHSFYCSSYVGYVASLSLNPTSYGPSTYLHNSVLSFPPMSPKSVSLQVGFVKRNLHHHPIPDAFCKAPNLNSAPLFFLPACQLAADKHQNHCLAA
ncbi:unnamed protein product [Protopolystoma xenopodis]|uniref:Uncharacterized protein n=1 Tax=Protopolystoma xenopodis TaxID=117903 RepID=A0A448XG93_9PLAT|nr:unnamed protein product [Protopolystoma xenopodis]